ncbi:MAG TPA: nitronate monooxygenase [Thermoleophilaceae bacterium]|nr:nitronate monooxygenase [Thermoleophilaceae bacterium]
MTTIGSVSFELPVVQAGMGGGLSQHQLAAAVSGAGGLGTVGMTGAGHFESEIRKARELTSGPIAANLMLPLTRRRHWEIASAADLVVTFWGRPRRRTARTWLHQCGSIEEAVAAHRAGADGVIVQGVEAGGHVRGTESALALLDSAMSALPAGYPVLSAGGLATREDVRERLEAGATAVVLGTRFLMTEESRAHTAYKQRLLEARETVLTELFGLGWPAPHRVIWNEVTEHWLKSDPRGPSWARVVNRLTAPVAARTPEQLQAKLLRRQSVALPLLSPQVVTVGMPSRLLDVTPLYAGQSVARIHDIRPAGELTRELAGAA